MVEGTPPGDALPPPPHRATPASKGTHCGADAGSPRPHQPHPGHAGRATLAARSRGRAAGGGTAPDTRCPSQRWQATSPGYGPPPPPRHAAPPGHAGQGESVGPPHPDTRAHSTWVADPNSPPSGRAVGGGTAPDLRRPSQWWKAPPPGTPSRHPHSEQSRPARAHAVGLVLGPHARTDRTRDTRVAQPWLPAPEDGRLGEGQPLTPDAPHNRGRPTPPGKAPNHPRGTQPPQGMQAKGTVLGPHTHTPAPTARGWRIPTVRPVGGQSGEGQPPTMVEGTPPGYANLPPPQPATPARKGARCGAAAGSPRPQRPQRGHTGRGTPASHSRGRVAGGGTAPDTRRPSQRWQVTPPGDGPPPPPRHAAPTGHAGQGDSVGPPQPHARAHSTWVADPNSPPSGRAVGRGTAPHNGGRHPTGDAPPPAPRRATPARKGARCGAGAGSPRPHRPHRGHTGGGTPAARPRGWAAGGGTAPDTRRPSQRWKALPPPLQRATPARKGARCGADAGSHARTDRTRDTRVAEPRLPAPEDGRPGEGQRLTPDAPHNAGGPPPAGTAPHHPDGTQPPQGMQAKGTVKGPHTHTPGPTARGWRTPTARPVSGQSGEGECLTSDAFHNGGRHPPRGRSSAGPTASNAGPQGRTLWGRCWVPTPAPTAPGTQGSRNPGCPPQRTGGRGRDSA